MSRVPLNESGKPSLSNFIIEMVSNNISDMELDEQIGEEDEYWLPMRRQLLEDDDDEEGDGEARRDDIRALPHTRIYK